MFVGIFEDMFGQKLKIVAEASDPIFAKAVDIEGLLMPLESSDEGGGIYTLLLQPMSSTR